MVFLYIFILLCTSFSVGMQKDFKNNQLIQFTYISPDLRKTTITAPSTHFSMTKKYHSIHWATQNPTVSLDEIFENEVQFQNSLSTLLHSSHPEEEIIRKKDIDSVRLLDYLGSKYINNTLIAETLLDQDESVINKVNPWKKEYTEQEKELLKQQIIKPQINVSLAYLFLTGKFFNSLRNVSNDLQNLPQPTSSLTGLLIYSPRLKHLRSTDIQPLIDLTPNLKTIGIIAKLKKLQPNTIKLPDNALIKFVDNNPLIDIKPQAIIPGENCTIEFDHLENHQSIINLQNTINHVTFNQVKRELMRNSLSLINPQDDRSALFILATSFATLTLGINYATHGEVIQLLKNQSIADSVMMMALIFIATWTSGLFPLLWASTSLGHRLVQNNYPQLLQPYKKSELYIGNKKY